MNKKTAEEAGELISKIKNTEHLLTVIETSIKQEGQFGRVCTDDASTKANVYEYIGYNAAEVSKKGRQIVKKELQSIKQSLEAELADLT